MVNRKKSSLELSLLVFIMSLFIIGVGIYGVLKIKESNNSSKALYTDRMLPMNQLADIRFYTSNIIITAHKIIKKEISYSKALQEISQAQDSITINWKNYLLTYFTVKEEQLVLKARIKIEQSNRTIEKLKLALKKEDADSIDFILTNELYPSLNATMLDVSELLHLQIEIGKKINQNNAQVYDAYTQKIIWFLVLAFAFIFPFAYYLVKKNTAIISNLNLNDAKLFLTEGNYRNLIEYAGEAILIFDEEMNIIDLNDAACTLFGYSREELLEIKVSDLVPDDGIEQQMEDIDSIKKHGCLSLNRKIRRKDGSLIETEVSNKVMEGKGYFAIIRDVTARKKAEKAIKESEEKYRYLFDNNPAHIIIWDLETLRILEVNNAVLNKYGYSKEEWSRMSVLDYRPKESHYKIKDFAKNILKSNEAIIKRNWRHYKKNGEEMIMEITSHKIDYNNRKAILSLSNEVTNQVKVEAKLREREAQLDLFIVHSPASLAMFDNEMRYISTSHRWIEDYNLSGQDIIGKSHYEVFPEIGQEWKDKHQRCLQGAVEKREEDSFIRANGNLEWIKWEVRPWYTSSNEIGGIIMLTEVITARKKATELFKNLFENSPDIILYVNKLFKIEAINSTITISKEDTIGKNCISILPDKSKVLAEDALKKCFESNENQEIEHQLSNGSWVRSRFVPIKTKDEVTHVMIFATGITEKKQAELQLLQSEEKYRALTENISDAVLLLNKEGQILYQSPTAERISGYSFDESKNKKITEFLTPDELSRGQLFFKEIFETPNVPKQNQFKIFHKKGHEIWIEGTVINLLENESIKAIILNYRDITRSKMFENELIRYNNELKKTNTELDRFVYSASHDLRAPLKSMLGLIYITSEDIKEDETLDKGLVILERLDLLNTCVNKLDDFIEDILDYSRNARLKTVYEEINFEDLVNEVRNNLKFTDEKQVNFNIFLHSKKQFVSDVHKLKVVLNNLISNAYKYSDVTKEKSFINITFTVDNNKATIIIEDNGIGIAEKETVKIFDMFYRSTTMSTGSGLGLYIVKEVIEKLGGKISVESELGKTSKFSFEIPNQTNT